MRSRLKKPQRTRKYTAVAEETYEPVRLDRIGRYKKLLGFKICGP